MRNLPHRSFATARVTSRPRRTPAASPLWSARRFQKRPPHQNAAARGSQGRERLERPALPTKEALTPRKRPPVHPIPDSGVWQNGCNDCAWTLMLHHSRSKGKGGNTYRLWWIALPPRRSPAPPGRGAPRSPAGEARGWTEKKPEEKSYDALTGPASSKGRRGLRIEFLCRGNGPQRSLRRRLISSNSSLMASLSKG